MRTARHIVRIVCVVTTSALLTGSLLTAGTGLARATSSTATNPTRLFTDNEVFPDGEHAAPRSIVVGPDGALWFTEVGGDPDDGSIGRLTTSGVMTHFRDPRLSSGLSDIVAGSDGALWFILNGNSTYGAAQIGRMTTTGALTLYPDPDNKVLAFGMVEGPDGAVWYGDFESVHRIATDGAITSYTTPGISPKVFVVGPDGAVWFGNSFSHPVPGSPLGRITTAGVFSSFAVPDILSIDSLAVGPDGAFWFGSRYETGMWRMTTAGAVSKVTGVATVAPVALATGSDHALWYTTITPTVERRVLPGGATTSFTAPSLASTVSIVAGPDKAVWFTADLNPDQVASGVIGRISTAVPQTTVVASALTGGVHQTLHATVAGLPVRLTRNSAHKVVAVKGTATIPDGHQGTESFKVLLGKGKRGWGGTITVHDSKLKIALSLKLKTLTAANTTGVNATATGIVVKTVAGHAKRVAVTLHLHLTFKPPLAT